MFSAAESALSAQVQLAWTNFAKTGNPNTGGDAPWPPLGGAGHPRLVFSLSSQAVETLDSSTCALWAQITLAELLSLS